MSDRRLSLKGIRLRNIITAYKRSGFYELCNFSSDTAAGRSIIMIQSVISTIWSSLSSGVFYTSFLLANDINIVNIGIVGFIPFLACAFSFLSPIILERIPKRKWVLAAARASYMILTIAGVTVTPLLGLSETGKIVCFCVLLFLGNLINALFTAGYNVWHLKFLPEYIRPRFFSTQQILQNLIGGAVTVGSAFLADRLSGTPNEDVILVVFRWLAFGLGMLDTLLLALPKEYPYEISKTKLTVKGIFVTPFKHRAFIMTMLIVFMWNLGCYLISSPTNVFIVDDIGISYTLIYVLNLVYSLFLLTMTRPWHKLLEKWGWMTTFAYSVIMFVPSMFMYAFLTPGNYPWMYTALRIIQHITGVGMNLAWANVLYLHLPQENQTNYVSFYIVIANVGAFIGQMLGTAWLAVSEGFSWTVFGFTFGNIQMLFIYRLAIIAFVVIYILKNRKLLDTPGDH